MIKRTFQIYMYLTLSNSYLVVPLTPFVFTLVSCVLLTNGSYSLACAMNERMIDSV